MFGPRCGFVVVECRPPTLEKSTKQIGRAAEVPYPPVVRVDVLVALDRCGTAAAPDLFGLR